jgi:hypothetical protein
VFGRFSQPFLTERHGPDLSSQPNFAEHNQIRRQRSLPIARDSRKAHRKVSRCLDHTKPTNHIGENIVSREGFSTVPM